MDTLLTIYACIRSFVSGDLKTDIYDDDTYLNYPHASHWFNFGFWKNIDENLSFIEAAENLCEKLGDKLSIKKEDVIIDCGCGSGESLLLWIKKYNIEKVIGINLNKSQIINAKNIIEQNPVTKDKIVLICGTCNEEMEKLDIPVNVILSVDAAYHFDTRKSFLAQSYQKLSLGGRCGNVDLILQKSYVSSSFFEKICIRLICFLAGINFQNMITIDAYINQMNEIGYKNVEGEIITKNVFPGFVKWCDSQLKLLTKEFGLRNIKTIKLRMIKGGISTISKANLFHFVIVTGQKK